MRVEVNLPYANRIQLLLESYPGPLIQDGPLGAFDPSRDLEVYVDGDLQKVGTYAFDIENNRYLLYMETQFNLQGVVQVFHHMPNPPFICLGSSIGFGVVLGEYFGGADPLAVETEGTGFGFLLGDYFGGSGGDEMAQDTEPE